MTPHRFNPVMWAFALVVVLIFGAVAYRVVVACEPSSFELLKQLKVALGGCSPPSVGKTEPRSSVPPVASSPATLDPKRENRSEPAQTPGPKSRLPAGTDTKKLPAGDSSTADSAVVTPSVKSPETGKMDHGGVVQSPDSPKIEAPKGDAVPPQQPTTTNQSSKQERLAEWRALRNTAMKVFQPSDRDPRLVKIVQAATRDYEYRFAMEIARDIYYATTRDLGGHFKTGHTWTAQNRP